MFKLETLRFAVSRRMITLILLMRYLHMIPEGLQPLAFARVFDWSHFIFVFFKRWLFKTFHITAEIREGDWTYSWIMMWLAKQASWQKTHSYLVFTEDFREKAGAMSLPDDTYQSSSGYSGDRRIAYYPRQTAWSFWYNRKRVTVEHYNGYLHLSVLGWKRTVLDSILLTAKREYLQNAQQWTYVYVPNSNNQWMFAAEQCKRPMSSVILDPGIKEKLLGDARNFLSSRDWYIERGIPYRRGYLLYGAPGTGKTSVIQALAGELGLHIYVISLSRRGIDDAHLAELINTLPEKCIALIEDIDAAFVHGLSRGLDYESQASFATQQPPGTNTVRNRDQLPESVRITLSGLLNALDGVGAQEDRILFATTNRRKALDPALIRAGRLDVHVEFHLASRCMAEEMFKQFYLPDDVGSNQSKEEARRPSMYSRNERSDSGNGGSKRSSMISLSDTEGHILSGDKNSESPQSAPLLMVPALPKSARQNRLHELASTFAAGIPSRN